MIEEFRFIFRDRHKIAERIKDQGNKTIGWTCSYVPEELFYAAGIIPIRIFGSLQETPTADAYLYSNNCSFVRSCLEEGFKGKYHYLDGFIACNSCDHIRRFYDIWVKYIDTPFTHLISLPHKISEQSIRYFKDELCFLKEKIEGSFHREISEESLKKAIDTYNKTRFLLKSLYSLRKKEFPLLSGADVLDVVLAGMVMPKDEYNEKLERLLGYIEECPKSNVQSPRIRIMIVGSELDDPHYIKTIEDLGGIVVTDDLCNGARYFWDLVDMLEDPMEALARRYLTRFPCARMRPATHRINRIKEMAKEFSVAGIIYEKIKFCNLYGEEYILIRDEIKGLDIPILPLEREYNQAGTGQMKTRIQAFFENL